MADRKKVLSGLEHCRRGPIGCQKECPYKSDFGCRSQLTADALELLKEQEAIIEQYRRADRFLEAHGWKWGKAVKLDD